MKKLSLLILLMMTLLLASCSSKKNAVTATEPSVVMPPLATACRTNAVWTRLEVPMSIELSAPAKARLSGRLTMDYGNSLRFSVRVLGMEMGQLYADRDSVYLLIKPLKVASVVSLNELKRSTGMGLAELQCVLAGQSFAPGEGRLTPQTALRWSETNDNGMAGISSSGICDVSFLYTPALAGTMELTDTRACRDDICVNISYSDNIVTTAGVMPSVAQGACDAGSTRVRALWRLNWDRARLDDVRQASAPEIPSSYERLTPAQLIARLGSML